MAIISDGIVLEGVKLNVEPDTSALALSGAIISQYVDLTGLQTPGYVMMTGGSIDGSFYCDSAMLGQIGLASLHITQNITGADTTYSTIKYVCFKLSDVQIDGGVDLSRVKTSTSIYFNRMQIGGSLLLAGAKIADGVSFNRSNIGGSIDLSGGFETHDDVTMTGVSVGTDISAIGADMQNLVLRNTHIANNLRWLALKRGSKTGLFLYNTDAGALYDDQDSWPDQGYLGLNGFKYKELRLYQKLTAAEIKEGATPRSVPQTPEVRIEWLKRQQSREVTDSQPWQQLAMFYEERGESKHAKQVLYMMARVQNYSGWRFDRALRWSSDRIEENPLYITYPIAGLWLIGSIVFWLGAAHGGNGAQG